MHKHLPVTVRLSHKCSDTITHARSVKSSAAADSKFSCVARTSCQAMFWCQVLTDRPPFTKNFLATRANWSCLSAIPLQETVEHNEAIAGRDAELRRQQSFSAALTSRVTALSARESEVIHTLLFFAVCRVRMYEVCTVEVYSTLNIIQCHN